MTAQEADPSTFVGRERRWRTAVAAVDYVTLTAPHGSVLGILAGVRLFHRSLRFPRSNVI